MKSIGLVSLSFIAIIGCSKNEAPPQVATNGESARILQERGITGRALGLRGTKNIILTFDDGPFADVTPGLLDYLREERLQASFFLRGDHIPGQEDLLARMRDEGHEIGNHTEHHALLVPLAQQGWSLVYEALASVDPLIAPYTTGQAHQYFRAPGGMWCPQHATQMNQFPILARYIGPMYWDAGGELLFTQANGSHTRSPVTDEIWAAADHSCWRSGVSPEACAGAYLREIERKQGGIVLMHDRNIRTLEMVRILVPELRRLGYTFSKLDQIPGIEQYESNIAQTGGTPAFCNSLNY